LGRRACPTRLSCCAHPTRVGLQAGPMLPDHWACLGHLTHLARLGHLARFGSQSCLTRLDCRLA